MVLIEIQYVAYIITVSITACAMVITIEVHLRLYELYSEIRFPSALVLYGIVFKAPPLTPPAAARDASTAQPHIHQVTIATG